MRFSTKKYLGGVVTGIALAIALYYLYQLGVALIWANHYLDANI